MAVTQGDEISRRKFDKGRPRYARGWCGKVGVISKRLWDLVLLWGPGVWGQ